MHSLVLGTSRLGADDPDDAVTTATALLRSGHLIDTSNAYAGGESERALGRTLAGLPADERTAAAGRILTKVDADPRTGVFDADRVRRSLDESLTRLGVDFVPLLHLHDPYGVTVAAATGAGGAVPALVELRDEGVVGAIGVAAGPVPLLRRYVDTGAFDAVLCHNRWTLVDRSAEPLFAAARSRGMTVYNAAPFGGDLLVRGPRDGARYAYRPVDRALAEWTARLIAVCEAHHVSPASVALAFSTRSDLVDHTVVGISSAARLAQLHALAAEPVPDGIWRDIDDLGPAPTPIDDPADGGLR